jgi:hypothetical protein
MNAFILKLKRGQLDCECFVQQLKGKEEDIFIVNFTNSDLIRQFNGTKTLLHIDRQRHGGTVNTRSKDNSGVEARIRQLLEK